MRWSMFPFAAVLGLSLGAFGASLVTMTAYADPPQQGYAPDPTAIASQKQWIFRIDVKAGQLSLGPIRSKTFDKPEPTPRIMGRYAFELWVGKELLDRVRFNVPGAGDGPPRDDKRVLKRPAMDRITTHFGVRMADNPRATFAKFVDRATGKEEILAWPPIESDAGTAYAAAPDGGATTDAGVIAKPVDASTDTGASDSGARAADAGKPR